MSIAQYRERFEIGDSVIDHLIMFMFCMRDDDLDEIGFRDSKV